MKKNIFTYLSAVTAVVLVLSACKKNAPDQWLQDNITIVGKVPVVASFTVKPPQTTNVASGSQVQLDLRYWSDDPIDKINLRAAVGTGAQQTISSMPYQKAYSAVSKTDSLLLSYPVPSGLAAGTGIALEVEVLNKNALTKKTILNLKVQ